jgi:hypothetical protein
MVWKEATALLDNFLRSIQHMLADLVAPEHCSGYSAIVAVHRQDRGVRLMPSLYLLAFPGMSHSSTMSD